MALSAKEQTNIIVSKAMQAASARRTATKVIVIVLVSALILSGGAWGVISFIEANSMMVSINDTKEGLTLSATEDFAEKTMRINMKGPDKMDAITYPWLNFKDDVLSKEGSHHGMNYICYSFYLKNVSPTSPCLYTFSVRFTKDTKNISSAVRIMIIESDENCENEVVRARVFAKAKSDGTAECIAYDECEPGQVGLNLLQLNEYQLLDTNMTYPFIEEVIDEETGEDLGYFALREKGNRLSHDAYIKYTVVIWLEGTDLQCVNNIVGGRCSIQFEFALEEYLDPEYYGD